MEIDIHLAQLEKQYGDSIKVHTIPLRIRAADVIKELARAGTRYANEASQWKVVDDE